MNFLFRPRDIMHGLSVDADCLVLGLVLGLHFRPEQHPHRLGRGAVMKLDRPMCSKVS